MSKRQTKIKATAESIFSNVTSIHGATPIDIAFPEMKKGNVLIIGNTAGLMGMPDSMYDINYDDIYSRQSNKEVGIEINSISDTILEEYNTSFINLRKALLSGTDIYVVGDKYTTIYWYKILQAVAGKKFNKVYKHVHLYVKNAFVNPEKITISEIDKILSKLNMKFDYIIQNPPYTTKSDKEKDIKKNNILYIDFFNKMYDLLSEKGQMVVISPSTFLINVRKKGNSEIFDMLKNKISKHISKIIIENYNRVFGTALYMPFAITYIDKSKAYDNINFICFGKSTNVKSVYDCNLIGDYNMIWSILNKVKTYHDVMYNHIYDKNKTIINENTFFCKYAKKCGGAGGSFCGGGVKNGCDMRSDIAYRTHICGEYITPYFSVGLHVTDSNIQNTPLYRLDKGKHITDKEADMLYGTQEELENWKYFLYNNKLPLFINIALIFSLDNNSKKVLPWLTNKRYTDEEINKLFGFTKEEIVFMDKTIKKYERQSPWFKRYMLGPDAVSDEEVQKFIDAL